MRYKVLLRNSIILTDDYEDNEVKTLVKNIKDDLRANDVNYPVDVLNERNERVMSFIPKQYRRSFFYPDKAP